MINVTDVAIMTSYLMAWTNTHNALAKKMKDRNGVLKVRRKIMETVEVVIRIPKRTYDNVSANGIIVYGDDAYYIENAIAKGTVLPKRHDRLIDVSTILIRPRYLEDVNGIKMIKLSNFKTIIKETFTFIKASEDKEIENDNKSE